jgi:hypothetical protein
MKRDDTVNMAGSCDESLLLCLSPEGDNFLVLQSVAKLAHLFGSPVTGVCASRIPELLCDEGAAIDVASSRPRQLFVIAKALVTSM